ncbi:amino acid ABC transporter permease [Variovorax sp. PBL-E5]|uniref:amino acid ABC transporter permease n=1 Tax=Variovorax sp. PBL-E5 TaxID=434014 RepID=UPI001316F892|nr:amino acid ABC transporter permease [Variovorax sp. PBL-E5]VTU30170.1 Inner membrane amino-acid ABC transporter permease protein YhdY [Variovorax sp. PBL-E5]
MLAIVHDYWLLFLVGNYPSGPLGGLVLTLILSVLGLGLAFPFSVLLALMRTSPWLVFRTPAIAVIYVVRGLPLLMFIFWAYFGIPLLLGRTVSGFVTMLCALVIYESAYLAEVIRAGIEALPKGQVEAARSIGMTHLQTQRLIVLPQALYNMLPSMLNQFISTIKETSLGYVISVQELTFAATQVNNMLLTQPFEVYALLALTYFVLCFALTSAIRLVERSIHRSRTSNARQPAWRAAPTTPSAS